MNIFKIFEKSDEREKRTNVQSPLLKNSFSTNTRKETSSKAGEAPVQDNDYKTRSKVTQRSKRLSVTDLLAQVEQQTETFSKLFPLIDKQKYKARHASSETDSEDVLEQSQLTEHFKEKSACQALEQDRLSDSKRRYDSIMHEDGAACINVDKEDVFLQSNTPLMLTKSLLPPKDSSRSHSTEWFGVHIEYLVLDNKLKISVQRFEEENLDRDRSRRIAKLCLMPGNIQSQKVNVPLGRGALQTQQRAYFTGLDGSELLSMVVHVGIYLKQGLFKKDKLINEFSVPLQEINLMEPQMIWKCS